MNKRTILIISLILFSFLVGLFFYPVLPDPLATHWDANDKVNGTTPKFIGIIMLPLIALALFGILRFLPKLDPVKKDLQKRIQLMEKFIVIIVFFLLYIQIMIIMWNIDIHRFLSISILQALSPAIAVLFFYIGLLLKDTKRNWFIGIRTPWTLSSDRVWEKTHKMGSKLFKLASIFALLGVITKEYAVAFIFIPIVTIAVALIIYSYIEYKKEKSK